MAVTTQSGTTRLTGSSLTITNAFPGADVTRYVLTHKPAEPKVIDVEGEATTVVFPDGESMELVCDMTFQAAATAALPVKGTTCAISGGFNINIGAFANAINGNWYYAEANLTAEQANVSTGTVTFRKWKTAASTIPS
jgi:hypothetical protein